MKKTLRDEPAVDAAADRIRSLVPAPPAVALILGSGLSAFAAELENSVTISAEQIPQYPQSTVAGHPGKLVFGKLSSGTRSSPPLLVFQGRIHYYESGTLDPVVFPVHLAKRLGASILLVTNAAGGISRTLRPGDFMLLDDFLNLAFLRIPGNRDSLLPLRFPQARPFDTRLQDTLLRSASALHLKLARGTYAWVKGPSYESAAEIEMLRRLGADAVGMSTVPEIVSANQIGLRVAALSLISNLATGISGEKLTHEEVTETASRVQQSFTALMKEVLLRLGEMDETSGRA